MMVAHQPRGQRSLQRQRLVPMLAMPRAEPFDSSGHIFEVCWEGIRAMAFVEHGRATLRSRSRQDLTPHFPDVADRLSRHVHGDGVVLDGMLTAPDAAGVPHLSGVVRRMHGRDRESRAVPVTYQVFDILYRDFRPLLRHPLLHRKYVLQEAIDPEEVVQLGHYDEDAGITFYEASMRLGLPGMVAKDKASLYIPGRRSGSWLKVLAGREVNVAIGGYTLGDASRKEPFGSLLVGTYSPDGLRYLGMVSGGLQEHGDILAALLGDRQSTECPFLDPPGTGQLLYWCRPGLVARTAYGEISPFGELRFAVFKGLRPDLEPADCLLECLLPSG